MVKSHGMLCPGWGQLKNATTSINNARGDAEDVESGTVVLLVNDVPNRIDRK